MIRARLKRGCLIGLTLFVGSYLALLTRLRWLHQQYPQPEAIIILGCDFEREYFASHFAEQHPQLDIWISSGMPEVKSRAYFAQVGIARDRVHYDQQAIDTVTNFTTLLPILQRQHFRHVYLITSDFHWARSRLIAQLIWGSQGIIYTPVLIDTQTPPESPLRIGRDALRSLVWLVTGVAIARSSADLELRVRSLLSKH
jgi:uncharacterized SAM-binding protein YcdF (DUF218 family)